MQRNTQSKVLRERYIDTLLSGDHAVAAQIIEDGLSQELSHIRIYLDVLAPSIVHIGNLWHHGEINVAQEHLATQICLRQMDYLLGLLKPTKKLGLRVVVTAVEKEHHAMGARMFADFLFMDGWEVDFLGEDTPTKDLVDFVQQRNAKLVALSVTLAENLSHAKRAVEKLHELEPPLKVIVGGAALLTAPDEAKELGADAQIVDSLSGRQEVRNLLGLGPDTHTLGEYLQILGQRVQSMRKNLRWSQQELANRAGLDRTYISMVEHGKQNLTLGAVMKIADALEVNLDTLLSHKVSDI